MMRRRCASVRADGLVAQTSYPVDASAGMTQSTAYCVFRQKMIQRVGDWVALAEERIGKSGVQFYMMPGNDDDFGVDAMIAQSSYAVNPVGKTIQLNEFF